MKILEIAFHLYPGGVERFVVDLSNELSKHNDVTLMVLRKENLDNGLGSFYKNEINSRVKYKCLGFDPGLKPQMWWTIHTQIKKIGPDVVHFHGEGMPYWMTVPIMFSGRKIKYFQTIHNDIHHRYDKGFYKNIYMPLFVNTGKVKMIALSASNYSDLLSVYPKAKATCIVNGRSQIEPSSKFSEVQKEISQTMSTSSTKTFLHIGRCADQKNQNRLIRAFNMLVESNCDAQLLIIGDGFDSSKGDELKREACENVYFLGPKKNVGDYLLCSDFFCLSSNHEGMPITLLEAMICGTPAICTPVCGAVDVIKNGINGYISSAFTDESYLSVLKKAYDNSSSLISNAKEEAKNCPYTIEECAKLYLEYFRS